MKQYVKPDLLVENFELSKHIATCAWDMANFKDVGLCTATGDPGLGYYPEDRVFTTGNANCDYSVEDYCYTNGELESNVFNS